MVDIYQEAKPEGKYPPLLLKLRLKNSVIILVSN